MLKGRIPAYLVAGAIAAALLFWTFGKIDELFAIQDAEITEASRAQLSLHPALKRWRAKLAAAEQHNQQLAGQAHGLANELRAALTRGSRVDTVQVLVEIAREDSTSFAQCSVALLSCQQRAASAEHEADSLATRLEAQLRVKPKRCWVAIGAGVAAGQGTAMGATFSVSCGILRVPLLP